MLVSIIDFSIDSMIPHVIPFPGLGQNGETVQRAEHEHITLIQSIMDRCMRKESLLNELYLMLIKQTTDHPDPNSRVNLRHWALLSLACSVILPPLKVLRKYLIGHLKRCAGDFITEEGKFARFAEKCLFKTQGTRRRQWPPSREEIVCTINRRPIYARKFSPLTSKLSAFLIHGLFDRFQVFILWMANTIRSNSILVRQLAK